MTTTTTTEGKTTMTTTTTMRATLAELDRGALLAELDWCDASPGDYRSRWRPLVSRVLSAYDSAAYRVDYGPEGWPDTALALRRLDLAAAAARVDALKRALAEVSRVAADRAVLAASARLSGGASPYGAPALIDAGKFGAAAAAIVRASGASWMLSDAATAGVGTVWSADALIPAFTATLSVRSLAGPGHEDGYVQRTFADDGVTTVYVPS